MEYISSLVSSLITTVFIVFAIMTVGYLVGRVTIKGVSLGTAGVLLVALIYGAVASYVSYISIAGEHSPVSCSHWSQTSARPCL